MRTSKLSEEEIAAAKEAGIIVQNWFAVCISENRMPYAFFESELYANAYRDQFSATSIVQPWPMLIKDYRK